MDKSKLEEKGRELSWVMLSWAELSWAELSWAELNWVELSWAELSWKYQLSIGRLDKLKQDEKGQFRQMTEEEEQQEEELSDV